MKKESNFSKSSKHKLSKISDLVCLGGRTSQIQLLWQTLLLIALLLPVHGNAQLPCNGVDVDCVLSPTMPYKCITGTTNFQNQIDLGKLELANQSANVIQRIVIKGNVTVSLNSPFTEYTFPIGSEIVFADSESRLTIAGGNTLRLNGVKIYGCHEEAYGIRAMENSTLIAEGCEFSDGTVSIRPGSNISITENTFRRSLHHIHIESGPGSVNFIAGGSISGNKFFGDEFLKTPYAGQKSVAGMVIESTITVGKSNGITNEFRNFGNGSGYVGNAIYLSTGNVTIINTTFNNIAVGSNTEANAAIRALAQTNVTIQGLGYAVGSANTFQDCKAGVYLEHAGIDISNAKFTNLERCIVFNQISAAFPSNSVKVNMCRFTSFIEKYAIYISGNPLLRVNACEIQNCIFDDNSLIPQNRSAVFIGSNGPTSGEKVKINNNKVYFRDRSAISPTFTLSGFYVSNLQKGGGGNNEFYDEGNGATISVAVRMDGCDGFVWSNNDFIGNNTATGLGDKGFVVFNSPNCGYRCNYLSGTTYGMWFEGMCNSTIYQNSFNNHNKYGLYLFADGTVIGGQFKKYNTWEGIAGDAEAFLEFSNYNPNDPIHKQQVQKSLFTLNTVNQNTNFWANPRIIGGVPDNDQIWFFPPIDPPTWPPPVNQCPDETVDPSDPKLDYGEKGIVNGSFTPWKGYAANTWDAGFLLYRRMTEDATLWPVGSLEATWYVNNYNGNLGKLCRLFDGFVSLSSDAPTTTATQLFLDLNVITVGTTHEQNLKTDLRIFLEQYLSNGSSLTQQQVTDLTAIANQCRYEGGRGVVLARLALGQPSSRESDCPTGIGGGQGGDRINAEPLRNVNAVIFPNPVERSFSLQLDQSLQNATARLVNLQGQVLGNWTFSGDVLNIGEVCVVAGVYLLEVIEKGHVLSRNKIVFNR